MKKKITILCTVLMLLSTVGIPTALAAEVPGPQWESISTLRDTLYSPGLVSLGNMLYAVGGQTDRYQYSKEMQIFNAETKTWSQGPNLGIGRRMHGATIYDGNIYIFGGAEKNLLNSVEMFDLSTNDWTTVDTTIPTARGNFGIATLEDKIYIIGGSNSNLVEIYSPKTNTWTTGASLPLRISQMGCAVLNDKIYVFGGQCIYIEDNEYTPGNQVFCYDPITEAWTQAGYIPDDLHDLSVSAYHGKAVLVGGRGPDGSTRSNTYIYDPQTKVFSKGPKLNQSRSQHATAIIGDTIYAVGGQSVLGTTGTRIYSVEALDLSQIISPGVPEAPEKLSVLLNTREAVQFSVSDNLDDDANFTWGSSNSAVATVDAGGKVTAIAPGQCSIFAKSTTGNFEESIPVRVVAKGADAYRMAVYLQPNQRANLHLSDDPASVTWTSLDPSVATVDNSGKVTARADGLVLIQAQLNGLTHQIYVRVQN